MPLETIEQISKPGSFINASVLHTRTPDNKELIVLSGVVLTNLKGEAEWRRDTLIIGPKVPIPAGKMLVIEQGAPFVTINAIWNKDQSVNSGFAVDAFRITSNKAYGYVSIEISFAVRDVDAWLYRVGYSVTLLGRYETSDLPPIG
jgi:hypothetical protein